VNVVLASCFAALLLRAAGRRPGRAPFAGIDPRAAAVLGDPERDAYLWRCVAAWADEDVDRELAETRR